MNNIQNTKARVIAIYLPQYHPIPENDEVWGKGFTEWINVVQAKPLFKGHYQPHIPADFGFYDLRMPEVREMQAEYARKAGIEGFMYWQYYFDNGKMLLERPFEAVLASGKPDFPFCLGWANHSWRTRTWTRNTNRKNGTTMIMEQLYNGERQYTEHFMYNLPAFKDSRYITVDGKPFFVIWNPGDHSDEIKKMIKVWRKLSLENGLKGIHFVARQGKDCTKEFLLSLGFDAIYQTREEIAINGAEEWTFIHRVRERIEKTFGITININKADFAKNHKLLVNDDVKNINVYPQLCAGYDRSPRAGRKAQMFYNFTPDTWREHIKNVLSYVKEKDSEHNIIMLKSWNEWGESNYMEPDQRYGTAMLDVLQEELFDF